MSGTEIKKMEHMNSNRNTFTLSGTEIKKMEHMNSNRNTFTLSAADTINPLSHITNMQQMTLKNVKVKIILIFEKTILSKMVLTISNMQTHLMHYVAIYL